jgi:hypothetical protein
VHPTNPNERTEVYLHALIFVHDGAIWRASRPGEEPLDTRAIMVMLGQRNISLALDGNDPHGTNYLTRTTASDCTNATPTQWCETLGLSRHRCLALYCLDGGGGADLKLTPKNHVTLLT